MGKFTKAAWLHYMPLQTQVILIAFLHTSDDFVYFCDCFYYGTPTGVTHLCDTCPSSAIYVTPASYISDICGDICGCNTWTIEMFGLVCQRHGLWWPLLGLNLSTVLSLSNHRNSWTNVSWWRHQMEIFSALLAICAGNSPVTGEFPTQRPVTRSFDVYFDLRPKERLSKQWWGWWFETLSRSLWRHRNVSPVTDLQKTVTMAKTRYAILFFVFLSYNL